MTIDLTIIAPALVAGLLVLATHVPLGREVLQRGIIFIDLAVAQIAGLGVILATFFEWHLHGWETQIIAFVAALSGAILLGVSEHKLKEKQEALIGISFVLAATGSILLLSNDPHGGEQLRDLLTGQILWVNWSDLIPLAIATAIILLIRQFLPVAHRLVFYILFASAVTLSVQLVGVYLVFASLIIPAFFMKLANHEDKILHTYLIGVAGYASGLLGSTLFDLPAGAMIVWSLAICGWIYWTVGKS